MRRFRPLFDKAASAAFVVLTATFAATAHAEPPDAAAGAMLRQGEIVLFRHAQAPGVGDPDGFRLDDCTTQRNLDDAGREQARRIGERLKQTGAVVGAVLSSQWCRTRETARLMALGPVRDAPAFNSFFGKAGGDTAQTAAARALLLDWRGPGLLLVVTHQVNITALTGIVPASGEGIVLRGAASRLEVVGRVSP